VLSLEPTIALESQSDLKPPLDVVDTLVIYTVGCEHLFSSMNDAFTPIWNSLLSKTVSHVILKKKNLLYIILTLKDSLRVVLRKEDTMLMLQQVDCALLKKEKSRICLKSKLCGCTVSNSPTI
jgi:hypothetical protein